MDCYKALWELAFNKTCNVHGIGGSRVKRRDYFTGEEFAGPRAPRLRRMKSYTEFTIWLIDLNHYYRMEQWDFSRWETAGFASATSGVAAANGLSIARSISFDEKWRLPSMARRNGRAVRAHSRAFKPEEISHVFNLSVTENRPRRRVGARAIGPGGTTPDDRGRALSLPDAFL